MQAGRDDGGAAGRGLNWPGRSNSIVLPSWAQRLARECPGYQFRRQQIRSGMSVEFSRAAPPSRTTTSIPTWRSGSAASRPCPSLTPGWAVRPTSARSTRAAGHVCLGSYLFGDTAPCQPSPLIFLSYQADLSSANTITGPGTRQLTIAAYQQDPTAPPVTNLNLWTSTDHGTTWQQAQVTSDGDGSYTASYTITPAQ